MEARAGNNVEMPWGSRPSLLEVAPFVVDHMQLIDMTSLRRTCREGRAVADATIGSLQVTNLQLPAGETRGTDAHIRALDARQFAAFVHGNLARGARLKALTLHPVVRDGPGVNERRDAPENEQAALEILSAFSQYHTQRPPSLRLTVPHASLAHLSLCHVPYTAALASAIHSAAPHLSSLTIASDLSSQAALAAATPGLSRLITTCAPGLTSLTFGHDLHSVPQPLADAIAACTRLQHLQLSLAETSWCDDDGVIRDAEQQQELLSMQQLNRTFSALPALRSLAFERHNPAVPAEVGMSCVTHLTNLRFNGLDLALMENLTANVLSPIRHLLSLTLHGDGAIDEAGLRLLAAECSQLTCLAFERRACINFKGDGWTGRWRCSVPLPAALRELHINTRVHPSDLLALQLPPGLTRLAVKDLIASCSGARRYPAGAAGPAAGDGGHAAAGAAGGASGSGALQPSPCPGFDDLLEAVRLLHERGGVDGGVLALRHAWEPSPLMWPAAGDGHVRLFAALRPLRLKGLVVDPCVLEVGDVLALVEQLTELEVLILQCNLHPAAVPLLARLPQLTHLTLHLPCDRDMDTWSCASAVAAALCPLLLGGPSLQRVLINPMQRTGGMHVDANPQVAAVQEGVVWLRAQLQRLGRDPQLVVMA